MNLYIKRRARLVIGYWLLVIGYYQYFMDIKYSEAKSKKNKNRENTKFKGRKNADYD